MEFSIRRVNVLFKKELKDIGKNANVICVCALPVLFTIIYSKIFKENSAKIAILILCLQISLVLVSQLVIAVLIAEEKEKNTLRTLMLSGMSPLEFLAGKALITLLTSVVINIAMFFIIGVPVQYLCKYIILTTLVALSMIGIGAVIGAFSSNQMATCIVGMPVMVIFLMIPVLANLNKALESIAKFFPNYNMNLMLIRIFGGKSIGHESLYGMFNILAWIVIIAVCFAAVYNKKGLDK